MSIDLSTITKIREMTGAGIVDVKKALEEAGGNVDAAVEVLKKKGAIKAAKKSAERTASEGIIEVYTHAGGKVGVMLELLCETDFVARNEEFKSLAHDIALHIAAVDPIYLSAETVPPEVVEKEKSLATDEFAGSGKPASVIEKIIEGKISKWYSDTCLLSQAFVKDEDVTIQDLVNNASAKVGEKIEVKRFCRYAISSGANCELA
jgi:elongation factor Ts